MRVSNVVHAVDTHVCGEPGRVIVGGVLDVPGATMFEKMQYLETEADELRLRMLREPRGYPAANCNLILPPSPRPKGSRSSRLRSKVASFSGPTEAAASSACETGTPTRGRHPRS